MRYINLENDFRVKNGTVVTTVVMQPRRDLETWSQRGHNRGHAAQTCFGLNLRKKKK